MQLVEKLAKVMKECAHIGKDAVNDDTGYPYVSAAKINDVVNSALSAKGIAVTATAKLLDLRTVEEKVLATVEVKITLHDGEETLEISGVGSGIDAGDKSVAKAQTMAAKYAWKNTLLIAESSDDPDAVGNKVNYQAKKAAPAVTSIKIPF